LRETTKKECAGPALPVPGPDALTHSQALRAHILEAIDAAGGCIPFSRFMELALYAPGMGYYSAGATKLGRDGDFVTAPEVSALFSRCLAGQVSQVLEELGTGDVLELGPGSGVMAADMLEELERRQCLPGRYWLLEVSADLKQRQQSLLASRLPHLMERVRWLDQLPDKFEGVIVGNEVMDALPVERFRVEREDIVAEGVARSGQELAWQDMPPGEALRREWQRIHAQLPAAVAPGYTTEICLQLGPWLKALDRALSRGLLLLIDYGLPRVSYYHPERTDGTLICHYRHRAHFDPLQYVGLQDITAWVDFTRVAEAAADCGMDIMGYSTQAHFLIGAGIETFLGDPDSSLSQAALAAVGQMKKLTLPGEMGERFKVIGLTRDLDTCVSGFGLRDLTHTL
jgi:SAM-dependent MidA family methyltransferase